MLLLLPIMAIVNATVPVGDTSVPIQLSVEPVGTQQVAVSQAGAAPQQIAGLDLTAIAGIITTITGALGAIGFKLSKDSKRDDTRANIMAETQLKQVQSLQATDKADYIFKSALAEYIKNPADESAKQRLINLAQQSHEEYSAYYDNIKPTPADYSKDKVVQKLSAVQKRVTPEK